METPEQYVKFFRSLQVRRQSDVIDVILGSLLLILKMC